ncbi:aspartate ammonia-lyase [Gluconacetobacter takamatsuzukensis]|uniref:Aspartate ammonia-lyase n=1 Tax=Gluconacetobacter takamatsuzukensis TaxID=1286190 RepID=A0A7W4PSZ5_9PROT|nr:aspartate ammonia-lyase [Gluconacetobacter takamatsuzukensis]MBB2205436.1 aspartate ammonia-lyase [Gluconacetobacter takamatsuzukensis]
MADTIRNDDSAARPAACRIERDLLGPAEIPADAFWGVHTSRAIANFPISGTPIGRFAELVQALAIVKQAAARTNHALGDLDGERAAAIEAACIRIRQDRHSHSQFVVDAMQGGAGTSTNMNANEVIANLALEIMGRPKGDYAALHPNDHVNMAQSTNDAYPTALRLAALFAVDPLLDALAALAEALDAKAREFAPILKVGRTQLRDAVPMTLGQEFGAFRSMVQAEIRNLRAQSAAFLQVNLGGTAIGTGINTRPDHARLVTAELARLTGHPITSAPDFIEATSDVGAFTQFSGALKRLALKLSKIAGDLRLLSSGPRAGLGEIVLPAVQAGSSIMPGKINPVIPEMVSQVAYLVAGHDVTITLCAEGGQLQLNPFEPMISYCLLSSISLLTPAIDTLRTRCIAGIAADRERCRALSDNSLGVVTALVPVLGYETCSALARRALAEGSRIADLVLEEDLLSRERLTDLLSPDRLTSPNLGSLSVDADW